MRTAPIVVLSLLCALLASPASADNDRGKGNNHGGDAKAGKSDNDHGRRDKEDRRDGQDRRDNEDRDNDGARFDRRAADPRLVLPYQQVVIVDRDRNVVRTYYRTEHAAGRCPPGLAKKNNGCLPPGQTGRAWAIGQPLPPEIVYEPMPPALWNQLTPPPYGYEYARVADDIVLMSTATRVIAGLLGNLGSVGD
jgi:Ni/Co efflux regulator RcnB